MSVNLSPVAGAAAQFLDNSGNVLTGGKLYTYLAGTTTPAATYTSSLGITFHSNPIILDAAGRIPAGGEIWLSDNVSYKFVLKDANDVLLGTWDNLVGINSNFVNYTSQEEIIVATAGQTVFNLSTVTYVPGTNSLQVFVDGVNQYDGITYAYVETDATTVTFTAGLHVGALVKFTTAISVSVGSTTANLVTFTGVKGQSGVVQDIADADGSNWIGFQQAGTGALATSYSVQDKLRQTVSVTDFGAVGDGVTDDQPAVTAAIAALFASGGNTLYFPDGTYYFAAPVTITYPNTLYNRGLRIVGTSMAGFVSAAPGGSKIIGASGISSLFIITKTTPTSAGGYSFECNNIDFNGSAKTVGSAILNLVGGAPSRPFNVTNCNFVGFEKAIFSDISATGLTTGICQVNITQCNFQGNDYALYGKGQSAIMDLRFVGNVCEQNTLGGIYTEAIANGSLGGTFVISDNLLEGQPNSITLNIGLGKGEISRNYFEGNTGSLINVYASASTSAITIKDNFLTNVSGTNVFLRNIISTVEDAFSVAGVNFSLFGVPGKSWINNRGIINPKNIYLNFVLDYNCVSKFTNVYPGTLTGGTYVTFGGANATTPVGSIPVTTVTGNSSIVDCGQTVNTGDWVVVMALVRPQTAYATAYAAFYSSVNASLGNAGQTVINRTSAIGEWVFILNMVQVTGPSGGNFKTRWVTTGTVDIAQTYAYKVVAPTLDLTPIYYCLPQ